MAELSPSLDVSNVFVYVGDAVRWDRTADSVLERGFSCRTIAASIHSPPAFASLVTGRYPPRHGVTDFTNRLGEDAFRLFDLPGYDCRFVNSVTDQSGEADPIFSVLDVQPSAADGPFDGLEEPFVAVERGPGGHAPYGAFDGSAWEYFERRGAQSADAYREEYDEAIERDAALFERRLEELTDRGLRDETLVVYTSDHGELLGEMGLLGHNGPMHPALVTVPTVFVHPELPTGRASGGVFRHVDLLPTLVDYLGEREVRTDGRSVRGGELAERGASFYRTSLPTGGVPGFAGSLAYEGVWDASGGRVFARTAVHERTAALLGTLLESPKRDYLRANLAKAFRAYAGGDRTYGSPALTPAAAERLLDDVRREEPDDRTVSLSETQREQLEDLGYLS